MEPLRVNASLVIPASELSALAVRAGGPGGQNVNKVATKVVLRFSVAKSRALGERRKSTVFRKLAERLTDAGELVIQASRHRTRLENLEDARERLAEILRDALRPQRPRIATRPTRSSRSRRLADKREHGELKRRRRPNQQDD